MMFPTPFVALVSGLLFTAAGSNALPLSTPLSPPARLDSPVGLAPIQALSMGAEGIEDSYIVVLKDDIHPTAFDAHMELVQTEHSLDFAPPTTASGHSGLKNVYAAPMLKGYAGTFSSAVIDAIRSQPEVAYVERDQIVKANEVEIGAPWGLARISHRNELKLSTFNRYEYDAAGGEGVDVYVIDTGINIDHVELQGRGSWGKTIPKNDVDKDGNGHGSHCAGTIASRKYGVAKAAHVVAVKVLGSNGSGSMSDVVDGVLFAAESALEKAATALAKGDKSHKGSVASMSLGGGKSPALDKAVNSAVESGLHFAVAAGNDNADACNYSPAAAELAISVGASTLSDERAYFSNHGKCVDIFAPGLNILSIWNTGNTSTNTISGTSMACPHIAGLLAYYISIYGTPSFSPSLLGEDAAAYSAAMAAQEQSSFSVLYAQAYSLLPKLVAFTLPAPKPFVAPTPPTLTPAKLKKALIALATKNVLNGELPAGTPNLLAFNNYTTKG